MHWTEIPIHIIDFEGNQNYGIVEYGVVTLLGGDIVETYSNLCRAREPIDPKDVRLHGIRYQDTLDREPFSEQWERFTELRNTGPLGAHHAQTENRLIKSVWPHPSWSPDFINPGKQIAEWGPWIDTHVLFRELFPQYESHKLKDLVRIFCLEEELIGWAGKFCPSGRRKFHCALYDALASASLLKRLGQLAGFEGISIDWLITHSAGSLSGREKLAQGDLFET